MAIKATTTSSSISVKPAWIAGAQTRSRLRFSTASLPGADVGVTSFATGAAIGAKAADVDLALHARVGVLVGPAPGSLGSLSR